MRHDLFWTPGRLAKELGVHRSTIHAWLTKKLLPHQRTVSGRYRFTHTQVAAIKKSMMTEK